jgi:hypothetical protein
MDELDSEQTFQLNKMIKRWKTHETMTPHLAIFIFLSR